MDQIEWRWWWWRAGFEVITSHGIDGDRFCEAAPDESEGKCGEAEELHVESWIWK